MILCRLANNIKWLRAFGVGPCNSVCRVGPWAPIFILFFRENFVFLVFKEKNTKIVGPIKMLQKMRKWGCKWKLNSRTSLSVQNVEDFNSKSSVIHCQETNGRACLNHTHSWPMFISLHFFFFFFNHNYFLYLSDFLSLYYLLLLLLFALLMYLLCQL